MLHFVGLWYKGRRPPMAHNGTNPLAEVGRAFKHGGSVVIRIPGPKLRESGINPGDFVAVRVAGEKLIIERVAMERLARVRMGELDPRPEEGGA